MFQVRIHFHAAKVTLLFYAIVIGVVVYNITAQDPKKQPEVVEEQVLTDAQTIKILFITATVFNVVLLIASMRTIFLYGHHLGVIMSPGIICRDNPEVRSIVVDVPNNSNGNHARDLLVYTPNSTPSHMLTKSREVHRESLALKLAQTNNDGMPATPPPSYQKTDVDTL